MRFENRKFADATHKNAKEWINGFNSQSLYLSQLVDCLTDMQWMTYDNENQRKV